MNVHRFFSPFIILVGTDQTNFILSFLKSAIKNNYGNFLKKYSMIKDMPPKGVILSDFIRTFAILCFVSIENLFVYSNTKISEFSGTTKFMVTFCCSGF